MEATAGLIEQLRGKKKGQDPLQKSLLKVREDTAFFSKKYCCANIWFFYWILELLFFCFFSKIHATLTYFQTNFNAVVPDAWIRNSKNICERGANFSHTLKLKYYIPFHPTTAAKA